MSIKLTDFNLGDKIFDILGGGIKAQAAIDVAMELAGQCPRANAFTILGLADRPHTVGKMAETIVPEMQNFYIWMNPFNSSAHPITELAI